MMWFKMKADKVLLKLDCEFANLNWNHRSSISYLALRKDTGRAASIGVGLREKRAF